MQNNQKCSCGANAQMACRCKYEIRYFCLDHFGSHTKNDFKNHIPLFLAQAQKWAAPSVKHRNYKLYKIDLKLSDYSKKIEKHTTSIKSALENVKTKVDRIFQSKAQKCENLMNHVIEAKTMLEKYKSGSAEEVIQLLKRYKAEGMKAVLPDYEKHLETSMSEVLEDLARELGVSIYEEYEDRTKEVENLERRIKLETEGRTEAEQQIKDLSTRLEGLAKWKEETIQKIIHLESAILLKQKEKEGSIRIIAKENKLRNDAQTKVNELTKSFDDLKNIESENLALIQKLQSEVLIKDNQVIDLKVQIDEERQFQNKARKELDDAFTAIARMTYKEDEDMRKIKELEEKLLQKVKQLNESETKVKRESTSPKRILSARPRFENKLKTKNNTLTNIISTDTNNGAPMNTISYTSDVLLESNWNETVESFDDMGLKEQLLRGIYSSGIERPSPIQQKVIKPILLGRDVIAQAQPIEGKSISFIIGLLQKIDISIKCCQALILTSSREVVQQTMQSIHQIGDYMQVKCHACIGGTAVRQDTLILQEHVHIVVGTVGRILDMMRRKHLSTTHIKIFIIDEADRTVLRDFIEKIEEVLQLLPEGIQYCLFSATMPSYLLRFSEKYMRDPSKIIVKADEYPLENIKQYYISIAKEDLKFDTILNLYKHLEIDQLIIYCNTHTAVEMLATQLKERNLPVSFLHNKIPKEKRRLIMSEFSNCASRVLISTDAMVKNISLHQVSLIINYDVPTNLQYYLHRIERTGKLHRKADVINLVTKDDEQFVKILEIHYNTTISKMP